MDINEGITYVLGENTDNGQWIADVLINKNTPMYKDMFAKMRELFWSILKKLIELFS